MSKSAVGFRVNSEVKEGLEEIALKERRTVSVIVAEMVLAGIHRYKVGGWSALKSQEPK